MHLPDVQSRASAHAFKLTRVGITGVRKPITVTRNGATHTLVGVFDVFVDLPSTQRGTHMSRNVEAINATVDAFVRAPVHGLEELALDIAKSLLAKHDYASVAEVSVEADYFRERRTPDKHAPTLEHYMLYAGATAERDGPMRKAIGAEVVGMTACPCAMEGSRAVYEARGVAVPDIPTITHNQRNVTSVVVETDGGIASPDADALIDLAEESLSAPTFELLKRGDETALVMRAHENPKFVEDVVREALAKVVKTLGHLPDDTVVSVRSEAEESIHKHNAVAERTTLLGELRQA